MPLLYFIVMVGVLVFVHELGHFLWAKTFGVRVLRFSLGFGPRIAGFRKGGTDYVVSLLPLGGYVRMLGENPRDEVRERDKTESFAEQSILRRLVIVVGGPLMNLLFPILLFFVVYLGDSQLTPAAVGIVLPDSPAQGKLQPGDRVVAIDGDPIETFYDLTRVVESHPGTPLDFEIERHGERVHARITPARAQKELPLDMREQVGRIGVMPRHPSAVIGVRSAASPAGAARLRTFDMVVAAGGRPVDRFTQLERALDHNRGALMPLTVLRPEPVHDALGGLVELDVYDVHVAALTPEPGKGHGLARAGLESADLYVSHVTVDSPEHRAGLLPGDRLVSLDGEPIELFATFERDLRAHPGAVREVVFQRGESLHTARFVLERRHSVTEHGQVIERPRLGIRNWVPTVPDPPVDNPHPVLYAARESVRSTAQVVELTVFSVVRLLQGRLSVKSIGGPLTIFEVAGTAAQEGALNYLTLMAFISINLGLINLLPIPLLDGGHLPFLFYEAVARRPVAIKVREYAQIAGFAILIAIMVLAFKNDIERQWPAIVEQLASP